MSNRINLSFDIPTPKLKMVKNSHLEYEDNLIKIIHYKSNIFEYDTITKTAQITLNYSLTSNKMINRAIDFFKLTNDRLVKHYYEGIKLK